MLAIARTHARRFSDRFVDEVRFLRAWVERPLTTGAVAPAAKPAQKQAATPPGTANASADTVGDICLLPDIARPTH